MKLLILSFLIFSFHLHVFASSSVYDVCVDIQKTKEDRISDSDKNENLNVKTPEFLDLFRHILNPKKSMALGLVRDDQIAQVLTSVDLASDISLLQANLDHKTLIFSGSNSENLSSSDITSAENSKWKIIKMNKNIEHLFSKINLQDCLTAADKLNLKDSDISDFYESVKIGLDVRSKKISIQLSKITKQASANYSNVKLVNTDHFHEILSELKLQSQSLPVNQKLDLVFVVHGSASGVFMLSKAITSVLQR